MDLRLPLVSVDVGAAYARSRRGQEADLFVHLLTVPVLVASIQLGKHAGLDDPLVLHSNLRQLAYRPTHRLTCSVRACSVHRLL